MKLILDIYNEENVTHMMMISFELQMGFENFVVINKIHPLKQIFFIMFIVVTCMSTFIIVLLNILGEQGQE